MASDDIPRPMGPCHASRDQLRALAHPLRLEIMTRVGRRGTARAADIAADLGIPANSVSYHLRILARGGVIVEAPEAARDRRDRVWTLAQHSFEHGQRASNNPGERDRDYLDASAATSLAGIDWFRNAWTRHLATLRDSSATSEGSSSQGTLLAMDLRMSPQQAEELTATITAAIKDANRLNRDEHGVDLPGDPDSEGCAQDFRILFAITEDSPSAPDHPAPHSD